MGEGGSVVVFTLVLVRVVGRWVRDVVGELVLLVYTVDDALFVRTGS